MDEFEETVAEDNDIPRPAEEWRAHDSSREDDLHAPVRDLNYRLIMNTYLIGRGIKVRVDHGGVHFPFPTVSRLSKFLPVLDLVVHAKGR